MTRPTVPVTADCGACFGVGIVPRYIDDGGSITRPCRACGGSGTVSAQLPATEVDRLIRERVEAMDDEGFMLLHDALGEYYDRITMRREALLAALGCMEGQ